MVFETFQCTAPQFQTHTRLKTSRSRSRSAPAHRIESAMRSAGCCEPSCARSCAAACRRGNLKALPCNPAPSRRLQQHTPPPPLFNSKPPCAATVQAPQGVRGLGTLQRALDWTANSMARGAGEMAAIPASVLKRSRVSKDCAWL